MKPTVGHGLPHTATSHESELDFNAETKISGAKDDCLQDWSPKQKSESKTLISVAQAQHRLPPHARMTGKEFLNRLGPVRRSKAKENTELEEYTFHGGLLNEALRKGSATVNYSGKNSYSGKNVAALTASINQDLDSLPPERRLSSPVYRGISGDAIRLEEISTGRPLYEEGNQSVAPAFTSIAASPEIAEALMLCGIEMRYFSRHASPGQLLSIMTDKARDVSHLARNPEVKEGLIANGQKFTVVFKDYNPVGKFCAVVLETESHADKGHSGLDIAHIPLHPDLLRSGLAAQTAYLGLPSPSSEKTRLHHNLTAMLGGGYTVFDLAKILLFAKKPSINPIVTFNGRRHPGMIDNQPIIQAAKKMYQPTPDKITDVLKPYCRNKSEKKWARFHKSLVTEEFNPVMRLYPESYKKFTRNRQYFRSWPKDNPVVAEKMVVGSDRGFPLTILQARILVGENLKKIASPELRAQVERHFNAEFSEISVQRYRTGAFGDWSLPDYGWVEPEPKMHLLTSPLKTFLDRIPNADRARVAAQLQPMEHGLAQDIRTVLAARSRDANYADNPAADEEEKAKIRQAIPGPDSILERLANQGIVLRENIDEAAMRQALANALLPTHGPLAAPQFIKTMENVLNEFSLPELNTILEEKIAGQRFLMLERQLRQLPAQEKQEWIDSLEIAAANFPDKTSSRFAELEALLERHGGTKAKASARWISLARGMTDEQLEQLRGSVTNLIGKMNLRMSDEIDDPTNKVQQLKKREIEGMQLFLEKTQSLAPIEVLPINSAIGI